MKKSKSFPLLPRPGVNIKQVLLLVVVAFLFASCALQKQITNTSKTLGINGAGVIQKPVVTNLKVNPNKFTSNYSGDGVQGDRISQKPGYCKGNG